MTTIYFVRHGEATGNVERNFHGWYDSPLTENGRKQIACLKTWFQDIAVDAIYASDLTRTYETAKAIAEEKVLQIRKQKNLREIHGGEWEDVPWDDLPIRFSESYENWLYRPHLLEMPGGESMAGFQDRIYKTVLAIIEENQGKKVVIVTHGTAIRVFLCRIRGIPLSEMPGEAWCDNASVTEITVTEEGFQVIKDGDNSHLGTLSTLAKQDWWKKEQ